MTWDNTLVNRLRHFIGDLDVANPDYTDSQLSKFVAVAAVSVAQETNLGQTYTIDTDIPSISPDPVITGSNTDAGVGNLFVTKAACIIARSELRKAASKYGVKIKDDITEYDGRAGAGVSKDTAMSFCESYEVVKKEWDSGNRAAGIAIFGPYANADQKGFFSPQFNYLLNPRRR